MIGDNVVITVVKVQGNKVRIGIQAPKDMPIVRAEMSDVAVAAIHSNAAESQVEEAPAGAERPTT